MPIKSVTEKVCSVDEIKNQFINFIIFPNNSYSSKHALLTIPFNCYII